MSIAFLFALLLTPVSPVLSVPAVHAATLTTDDLKVMASTTAQHYGLNVDHFVKTVRCESGFNPNATSTTNDFGIVQINAPSHPEITMQQMLDPTWSLDWMGQQWSAGNARAWTCWRNLYGSDRAIVAR